MSIADLEAEVTRTVDSGKFGGSLPLFGKLLRAYLVQPDAFNEKLVARVLVACLPQLGAAECTACLCMVPERLQDHAGIKAAAALDDALQRGDFAGFWALLAESTKAGAVAPAATFEAAMRAAMAQSLTLSFASIRGDAAAKLLNVASAADAAKALGGKVEGDFIVIPANEFNRPKPPAEPRDLTSANIAQLVRA